MNDIEFVDAGEAAAALDPAIGDGTPETAPHVSPFDADDGLDAEAADGTADDDDDVEDDDDAPVGDDV